jgi:hypothetical protein
VLRLWWALPVLTSLCLPAAVEAACPPARPVRVTAGAPAITLSGVFQIYQPPWRMVGPRDQMAVGGTTLPRTAEGEDARRFSGTLPATGEYLLVVGTSRGSGAYRLRVEIHPVR